MGPCQSIYESWRVPSRRNQSFSRSNYLYLGRSRCWRSQSGIIAFVLLKNEGFSSNIQLFYKINRGFGVKLKLICAAEVVSLILIRPLIRYNIRSNRLKVKIDRFRKGNSWSKHVGHRSWLDYKSSTFCPPFHYVFIIMQKIALHQGFPTFF